MKAYHIVDGPPYFTNCFLLVSENGNAVAIDPAADASRFNEVLRDTGSKLTHIFLTHGHMDHVAAADDLRSQTGAKLYAHSADDKMFKLNVDEHYTDFGKIVVDEMQFTTIFTPGHTPGSTCISCGDLLFSGDTLFAGDIGRTDFPGGSMEQMRESLAKLREHIQDDPQVLPGHEEFSTMEHEKQNNPYMRA